MEYWAEIMYGGKKIKAHSNIVFRYVIDTTTRRTRGEARTFQRGVSLCQSEGTHQMNSPTVVGCLLKKGLQKKERGGGGGGGGEVFGHPRKT